MKKLSIALLSTLSFAALSMPAQAGKAWPNWYVGLHGSINFVGEENVSGNSVVTQLDQDTGAGYGVSLGYRPRIETGEWSNMRIEVQWHHQRGDIKQVSTAAATSTVAGDIRVNAAMLNLFYDATTSMPEWRPYVGAGIGFAEVQLKNAGAGLGAANADDNVFAWNLMAGVGYVPQSIPFTEWTLGYRYFATGDAEFASTLGNSFDMEYDSHNIEAGVKFLF